MAYSITFLSYPGSASDFLTAYEILEWEIGADYDTATDEPVVRVLCEVLNGSVVAGSRWADWHEEQSLGGSAMRRKFKFQIQEAVQNALSYDLHPYSGGISSWLECPNTWFKMDLRFTFYYEDSANFNVLTVNPTTFPFTSTLYPVNMAIELHDETLIDDFPIQTASSSPRWLTNAPTGFDKFIEDALHVGINDSSYLYFLAESASINFNAVRVIERDLNGVDTLGVFALSPSPSNKKVMAVGVGPKQINHGSITWITSPITIDENTLYYTVQLGVYTGTGTLLDPVIEIFRFYVSRCEPVGRIVFREKTGNFQYYSFFHDRKEFIRTKSKTFKKPLTTSGAPSDFGVVRMASDSRRIIELRQNDVPAVTMKWLAENLTPSTMIFIEEENFNQIAVRILDATFEAVDLEENIFDFRLRLEFANPVLSVRN